LSSTKQVDIVEHVLEALRGEMGIMQMQLQEVPLQHNALCEQLATCQAKCLRLEQDVATQQQALQKAFIRAIKAKIPFFFKNSMEDIECYHQTLIDLKQ
jgi:hypothetical protein